MDTQPAGRGAMATGRRLECFKYEEFHRKATCRRLECLKY